MNKFAPYLVFTLISTVGAVHASPTAHTHELKIILPKLNQGCAVLSENIVQHWLAKEASEQIRCLNAAYIPNDVFVEVLNGFKKECIRTLWDQIRSQLDGRDVLNMIVTMDQMTEMFRRHYEPVYRRFCAEMNPQTLVPKDPKLEQKI